VSFAKIGAARLALRAVLLALVFCGPVRADEAHPLEAIPTNGPRETLTGFLDATDTIYRLRTANLRSYGDSGRLYLDDKEQRAESTLADLLPRAVAALDTSRLSPVLLNTVGPESAVMLREVLDRIDLPFAADIPDGAAMARSGAKKWRVPDTEIDLVLIEKGPRAGQWLVSPETVARLPEYYARVKDLPDRSDVTRAFMDALAKLKLDESGTVYDAFLSSPIGLSHVVPMRWLLALPSWSRARALELAVWQWVSLALSFGLGAALLGGAFRLKRIWKRARQDPDSPRYYHLLIPVAILAVAGAVLTPLFNLLRIGGAPRVLLAYAVTLTVYLTGAWLCITAAGLLAETIVASERIKTRSLDGQLFQLAGRLIGLVGAIAVLIKGADALGLPAYSVVAGLGVGGLAVALAARDSVANLLGSILIMFEKPFRIGHVIKLSGDIGTVEDVGFRSTRIRTLDNSLISVPNNSVVNTTVENLTARTERRQRFFVQVTYDTPREKLDALLDGIKKLIVEHPFADDANFHVRLNEFGESSLNILVIVHLMTQDYGQELKYREQILLGIMDLATKLGVDFAFPTRTLQVESSASLSPAPRPARGGAGAP
jgi:MscS family membrane protein